MARPEHLLPGDIILYRNHGWLGALISWGEWTGQPGEALEYSHIGLVLDDLQSVEMNPPASRKFWLADVPWERVDVFRLEIPFQDQKLPINPFTLESVRAAFVANAVKRLDERYSYGFIAQAAGLSLLARIGLGGFSRWLVTKANPMPAKQRDVCSTWVEELLTTPIQEVLDPKFDIFPNLGSDRARPSDWPLSPFVKRAS